LNVKASKLFAQPVNHSKRKSLQLVACRPPCLEFLFRFGQVFRTTHDCGDSPKAMKVVLWPL